MKIQFTRKQSSEGLGGFARQEWEETAVVEVPEGDVPVGAEKVSDDTPVSDWRRTD